MLKIGDIIGERYRLKSPVGNSSFACSYLAETIDSSPAEELVFIKQIQPRHLARDRFLNEAKILAKLGTNSHIPALLDYFAENNQFFLIQEYIEGKQLKEIVGEKHFTEIELVDFLRQVLKTLGFIHQNKVIHRDINPDNIIIRPKDHRVFLVDFGAVKELSTISLDPVSKQIYTQVVGSAGYMPPEQYNGKPKYNSDIYALGRTAIFSLTGLEPLQLEDPETGKLRNWEKLTDISPSLARILKKMIEPQRKNRYGSVREILQDLEPISEIGNIIAQNFKITSYLAEDSGIRFYSANNIKDSAQSPSLVKKFITEETRYATEKVKKRLAYQRFCAERNFLESAASLPQIPKIWSFAENNQAFYLIEEWIDGLTLREEIENRGALPETEVVKLLENILYILASIHEGGFIHQNIQPEHIRHRSKDDKFMLVDFTLAKKVGVDKFSEELELSYCRKLGVQQVYSSPEQISGRATFSSDIYSLGITAIEALTAMPPDKLPPNERGEGFDWQSNLQISPQLKVILNKMSDCDLKKRYQQANQVLNDLKKFNELKNNSPSREGNQKLLTFPWYWYPAALILFLILLLIL